MELHGEQGTVRVLHPGDRDLLGGGGDPEPLWGSRDGVPVGHPDRIDGGEIAKQQAVL